jgi:hypothetical protein
MTAREGTLQFQSKHIKGKPTFVYLKDHFLYGTCQFGVEGWGHFTCIFNEPFPLNFLLFIIKQVDAVNNHTEQ